MKNGGGNGVLQPKNGENNFLGYIFSQNPKSVHTIYEKRFIVRVMTHL